MSCPVSCRRKAAPPISDIPGGASFMRAISVEGPAGAFRIISVEDVLAREARLLLDLEANVAVRAKQAADYQRLVGLVNSCNMETA